MANGWRVGRLIVLILVLWLSVGCSRASREVAAPTAQVVATLQPTQESATTATPLPPLRPPTARPTGPAATRTPRPLSLNYAPDQVVLQMARPWSPHIPSGENMIVDITLWGNGRAVFKREDGVWREARLDSATVTHLVQAAAPLVDLPGQLLAYNALPSTPGPSGPHFALQTSSTCKTVEAYGLDLDQARDNERDPATLAKLRGLWQAAVRALPAEAGAMPLEVVTVEAERAALDTSATQPWPPALAALLQPDPAHPWSSARLAGDVAREALRLVGPGMTGTFIIEGRPHRVTVRPYIPSLRPPADLPRHPELPACEGDLTAQGTVNPLIGVAPAEAAAWYREALAREGWRLAEVRDATASQETATQVWVRGEDGYLVRLTFRPGQMVSQMIAIRQGMVYHPLSNYSSSFCTGYECQWVRGLTPAQTAAWFREHLGYLGWMDEGADMVQRGGKRVQLRYEALEAGGTLVRWAVPAAPPEGWPTSQSAALSPLCAATRGREVQVRGQTVRLHSALCVTLQAAGQVRVQVVGGRSYVDLDVATGWQTGGMFVQEEANLRQHFEPLTGMRFPKHTDEPPPPPGASPTPLCQQTAGQEIQLAGRTVRLHPSICVFKREPGLLRLGVVGGTTYLNLDPATGENLGGGTVSGADEHAFEYLDPFLDHPLPRLKPLTPTPLCHATRAQTVQLGPRTVRLSDSLCVMAQTGERVRVQVVGGQSEVELDPATGELLHRTIYKNEEHLLPDLEAVAGRPLLPRNVTPLPPPTYQP